MGPPSGVIPQALIQCHRHPGQQMLMPGQVIRRQRLFHPLQAWLALKRLGPLLRGRQPPPAVRIQTQSRLRWQRLQQPGQQRRSSESAAAATFHLRVSAPSTGIAASTRASASCIAGPAGSNWADAGAGNQSSGLRSPTSPCSSARAAPKAKATSAGGPATAVPPHPQTQTWLRHGSAQSTSGRNAPAAAL